MLTQGLLALALAFLAESMTEYLFASWIDKIPKLSDAEPLKYIALLVGIGMAFAYRLDIIALAFQQEALSPWVGILLTGMAIGRGSNYVHDLWSRYLKPEDGS